MGHTLLKPVHEQVILMGEAVPTMPRRLLGGQLRRLRLDAGKSQTEAAKAIGKAQTRIVKVEDGRSTLAPSELDTLLDLYGASPAVRKEILAMGTEARQRQPKRAYVDLLPDSYQRVANLQSLARTISSYEKGIYPGLLQAPEYAEAVIAACDGLWWERSYQERANRMAFRLEWQRRILGADPQKQLEFVFTDDALIAEVGSPEVMRLQLEHMLRIIDGQSNVRVQVLKSTTPNNPAPSGGFTVLRFDERTPPIGFVNVVYGPSPYLNEPKDTNAFVRVFTRVGELALSPEESRALLEGQLKRSSS
jgi:transcriptional regulator with XRE-family HTH domain